MEQKKPSYTTIAEGSKYFSEEIAKYREIAERRREKKKIKQEFLLPMYRNMCEYIERERGSARPLTVSGLILASGCTKVMFYDIMNGKFDYALYQYVDYEKVDLDNTIVEEYEGLPYHINDKGVEVLLVTGSEMMQRIYLFQQEETERRLYEKGRVGDIFTLKAQHGWQEEEKQTVNNNTLVIASEEEAKIAMNKLLNG